MSIPLWIAVFCFFVGVGCIVYGTAMLAGNKRRLRDEEEADRVISGIQAISRTPAVKFEGEEVRDTRSTGLASRYRYQGRHCAPVLLDSEQHAEAEARRRCLFTPTASYRAIRRTVPISVRS